MTGYVGKRLLLLVPTLLGVSVLTFLLIHLIPGDLVTILLGITASQNEQTRQALIHALHLDQPLVVQYVLWLGEVLRATSGIRSSRGSPCATSWSGATPSRCSSR